MKRYCPKCGTELKKEAVFCPKCGEKYIPEQEIQKDNTKEGKKPENTFRLQFPAGLKAKKTGEAVQDAARQTRAQAPQEAQNPQSPQKLGNLQSQQNPQNLQNPQNPQSPQNGQNPQERQEPQNGRNPQERQEPQNGRNPQSAKDLQEAQNPQERQEPQDPRNPQEAGQTAPQRAHGLLDPEEIAPAHNKPVTKNNRLLTGQKISDRISLRSQKKASSREKETNGRKSMLAGIGLLVLVFILLMIHNSVNQKPTVLHLEEYSSVAFEGASGSGTAVLQFNRLECEKDIVLALQSRKKLSGAEARELLGRLENGQDLAGAEGSDVKNADKIKNIMSRFSYVLSKNNGLVNGEQIELEYFIENTAQRELGIALEGENEVFTVEGLTEREDLAAQLSDIPEGLQEELQAYALELVQKDSDLVWPREVSLAGFDYQGAYLLRGAEGMDTPEAGNLLYQIFHIKAALYVKTNPDESETENVVPYYQTKDFYYYLCYKDITGKETPEDIRKREYVVPEQTCEMKTELRSLGENLVYTFNGFDTLEELYQCEILSRQALYDLDSEVAEYNEPEEDLPAEAEGNPEDIEELLSEVVTESVSEESIGKNAADAISEEEAQQAEDIEVIPADVRENDPQEARQAGNLFGDETSWINEAAGESGEGSTLFGDEASWIGETAGADEESGSLFGDEASWIGETAGADEESGSLFGDEASWIGETAGANEESGSLFGDEASWIGETAGANEESSSLFGDNASWTNEG